MTRKVHKTLILTEDLAERLESEDNMSQTVRQALRDHYELEAEQ